ncbi:MAG TPA: periplasmic heavy metal sensor [Acidobacteriaceae bacterium]|jgi:Spy/CpxP family protein refolding chaperone|nr:periplasmic heavy metal sensor [Acidobacteriaceae bacterium]
MKRITIGATVAVALLLTIFVVFHAEARGRRGWCGHRWHRGGPAAFLSHELKLNQAQQAQVKTLWQTERPTISANLHELLAENNEMNAIAGQGNPDQAKVHEIATREASTIAALLMEKEQLQSRIYQTVLNPDQRAKANALQEKLESHLDHAADRLETQPAEK